MLFQQRDQSSRGRSLFSKLLRNCLGEGWPVVRAEHIAKLAQKTKHEFSNTVVGKVQMQIETASHHFERLAMEVAIVIFVAEFPTRNCGSRRLPLHEFHLLVAQRSIDGDKMDKLIFAHEFVLKCAPTLRGGICSLFPDSPRREMLPAGRGITQAFTEFKKNRIFSPRRVEAHCCPSLRGGRLSPLNHLSHRAIPVSIVTRFQLRPWAIILNVPSQVLKLLGGSYQMVKRFTLPKVP